MVHSQHVKVHQEYAKPTFSFLFQVRGTLVLIMADCINKTIALERESVAGARDKKTMVSGYRWILERLSS